MTIRKTTSANIVGTPTLAATFRAAVSTLPNPATYLRAYQDMRRFQSLDDALIRDAGLSQFDKDRVTFGDFLKQPRR